MDDKIPFLSIVTPTYNRGQLLRKCYLSLLAQKNKDFQWVIVDDGSADDTMDIVMTFDTEDFEIVYVRKENGGKHTALNESMEYVKGKYVLILDSDDYLTPDAVETVRQGWTEWQDNAEVGMLVYLRGKTKRDPLCTGPVANEPVAILRYKRNLIHSSDCCEVLRTELYKKYPFPVFENERFMSEGVLWHRIDRTHKCVYVNDVIYICEYLEGGLTKSGRAMRIRNPRGGMLAADLCMGRNNYFHKRIKSGLLYTCYGYFAGLNPGQILAGTENKPVAALCLLPGYGLYWYWKLKYLK